MAAIHMADEDVAKDFAAVLEKISKGVEVVVERDHRSVAVIRSPKRSGLRQKPTDRPSRSTKVS
jgi:antitoxin (DNA-binding transcriptional repressor) of toxin-antitoxin stability system